ncbi:hypothetical protein EDB81DRAFT_3398 [Dactylonectria macrodidyma]|uniref:Uncharacterized protein n=1 Tax=Dactylonectria macrodidyma TaxID=307937 RepID=A0A9P9JM89_9HYPO|nr:hypothetical protein EDB81DRAFT_3398 [Dactylonectria macrodidyma]
MEERSSSRASGTTYHSFNEIELFEPASPPRPPVTYDSKSLQHLEHLQLELQRQQREALAMRNQRPSTATKMQRQDSGYESTTPPRRASTSNSRPSVVSTSNSRPLVVRRSSNGSSNGDRGMTSRFRNRPSLRRAAQSQQSARNSNQSLHAVRSNGSVQPAGFFHFPSPDPVQLSEPIQLADSTPDERVAPTPSPTPPPQTTHYWTSDRTRRLEYAAIDAATRGVKGWVLRHLVPECFMPKGNRHVSFDDDSGSVRRYRLDLEEDDEKASQAKCLRRRRGWRFWRRRKGADATAPVSLTTHI